MSIFNPLVAVGKPAFERNDRRRFWTRTSNQLDYADTGPDNYVVAARRYPRQSYSSSSCLPGHGFRERMGPQGAKAFLVRIKTGVSSGKCRRRTDVMLLSSIQ